MNVKPVMLGISAALLSAGILTILFLHSGAGKETGAEAEKAYIAALDAYTAEEYETAMEFIRKALSYDRNFYQASFLEAKILFFTGRREEADAVFSRLRTKYPGYTEARIWHIRCRILDGDYQSAREALETELSFNSTDWRIYYLYALLAEKNHNYEQRLMMNRQAEVVLSDAAKIYMDLAVTWYTLGLNDRAREYLEKARVISGANISMGEMENALRQYMGRENEGAGQ